MSFDNISGTVLCSVWMEYVCVGPFACRCATPNHHLSRTLWIFCQEHLPLSQNRHRPPKSLQTKYVLNIFITLIIFLCGPQTSNSNLSPILYKQTNNNDVHNAFINFQFLDCPVCVAVYYIWSHL